MSFSVGALVELLRMERLDTYLFRGRSPREGTARVYGGQMLAQSIMAMGRSVDDDRSLHSMHGYFLRPGDISKDILFRIEPVREGRSFSTRLLQAFQDDKIIFSGSASFQANEGDHIRRKAMPSRAAPEALESENAFLARMGPLEVANASHSNEFFSSLIERRSSDWRHLVTPDKDAPMAGFWCRLRESVDDDSLLHKALVAYISDLDLMHTAMRPRGIGSRDPAAQAASLDHAMWFHAPMRADRWFYYDIEGPCAINNRGLGRGEIYGQDQQLAITAMQEGLLRVQPSDE